ncbi:Acyl-CoA binding domain containing 5 [Sorochytrium milnesiophthora]
MSLSSSSSSPPPPWSLSPQQRDTEIKFARAVETIQSLPETGSIEPSPEEKLKFYGLYKQATEGNCNVKKPAFWDLVSRAKRDAWIALKDMPKLTAKQQYVAQFVEFLRRYPDWPQVQEMAASFETPVVEDPFDGIGVPDTNGSIYSVHSAHTFATAVSASEAGSINSSDAADTVIALSPEQPSVALPVLSPSSASSSGLPSPPPSQPEMPATIALADEPMRTRTATATSSPIHTASAQSPVLRAHASALTETQQALEVMQARVAALQEQVDAFNAAKLAMAATQRANNGDDGNSSTVIVAGNAAVIFIRHIIIDCLLAVLALRYLYKHQSPLVDFALGSLPHTALRRLLQRLVKL